MVLSADHGMADMPEYMTRLGSPAGRIHSKDVVAAAEAAGRKMGIENLVRAFIRPYLYLDHQAMARAGADRRQVVRSVARVLTDMEGVPLAAAVGELAENDGGYLTGPVVANRHAQRSGDIHVIQAPYWFLYNRGSIKAMHGTP